VGSGKLATLGIFTKDRQPSLIDLRRFDKLAVDGQFILQPFHFLYLHLMDGLQNLTDIERMHTLTTVSADNTTN
jgi:hypothetical protein